MIIHVLAAAGSLVVVGIAFVAWRVATAPDTFTISRSLVIPASADVIFSLIADLRAFNRWNPFARQDPTAQMTYSGPARGPGAAYAWTSKGSAGEGQMTVMAENAPRRVDFKLEFSKPFRATNDVVFTLDDESGSGAARTRVTWTMSGHNPVAAKVMSLIFCSDKMVGGMFEQGLANLRDEVGKQR